MLGMSLWRVAALAAVAKRKVNTMGREQMRMRIIGMTAAIAAGLFYCGTTAWAACGLRGDINCDGVVDFGDINPFVQCLTEGGYGHAGPVAWYPFDGNARDYGASGAACKGNNGTEYGGYSYVEGVCGSAISFDGTTGYADLAENPDGEGLDGFGAFTVAVWIKPATDLNAGTPRQDFLYKGRPLQYVTSYALGYGDAPGALTFGLHSASSWFNGAHVLYEADFPANEWFHLAGTYDGISLMQMYVNGVAVGAVHGVGMDGPIWDNSEPLTAGRRPDNNYYLEGALDEVRIYDRELPSSEIQSLYDMTCP